MSKARELADVIGTQDTTENVLQGRRNLLINGGFDVWQRSTDSGVGMSGAWGYYTADRVRTVVSSASGSERIYKKTDDSTFKNVMAVVGNGVGYYTVEWFIEESARLIDKKVTTFSFYAKVSSGTFDLVTGSHGAYISGLNYTSTTTTLTTEWQRIVVTVDLTNSTYNGNNEMEFRMIYNQIIPNGVEVHLAQAQLEVGSVATPFEHRSYGEELALCQRYFYATPNDAAYASVFGQAMVANVGNVKAAYQLPTPMRATPSVTAKGTNAGSWYVQQGDTAIQQGTTSFTGIWSGGSTPKTLWLEWNNTSGGTQGYSCAIMRNNKSVGSLDGVLWMDAEL